MIQLQTKEFWRATIALSMGSILVFSNENSVQPLLPLFTKEFHVSPAVSGLSVSLVIFTLSLALLFYGPFSDAVGRVSLMKWTLLGTIVSTLACAFAPGFELLLALRTVQGLFIAGLPSVAIAFIGEEYDFRAVNFAVGIYIGANTLGGLMGRVVSGIVADQMGWRYSFIILALIGLVCFVFFIILLPPSKKFVPHHYSMKQGFGEMVRHLSNPLLVLAFLIGGLQLFVFIGLFNFMTFRLSVPPFSLSSAQLGLLFFTYLAGTAGSFIAGKISNRIGSITTMGSGVIIMMISILVTLHSHLPVIILGLLLLCLGFFISHSTAISWVSKNARFSKASASGLYLISYYLGGSLGGSVLGFPWVKWGWPGVVTCCMITLGITFLFVALLAQKDKMRKVAAWEDRVQTKTIQSNYNV